MLNPFPELLTFSLLAPTLLRLAVGFYYLKAGYWTLKRKNSRYEVITHRLIPAAAAPWIMGLLELVVGLGLILGFYTQIAAVGAVVLSLGAIAALKESTDPHAKLAYTLLLTISLSLLVSGAGLFAFDLPL